MPPKPRPAPPADAAPAGTAGTSGTSGTSGTRRRGQLRDVIGGYDIHRLPITVSPLPGESAASWITALADRYGVTPAKLFQTLGIALPTHAPGRVLDHISAHRDVLASAAGLAGNQIDDLFAPTALDHAVAQYVDRYRATTCPRTPAAKYCPSCLRETGGRWDASWSNPVHIICQHHRVHLRDRCPSCGQQHWASPCWVTTTRSGRWCPEYTIRAHTPLPRRLRARCGQNLSAIDPAPAVSDELLCAQQLLFDLAEQANADPPAIRLCCGIGAGPASYFNAVMELIDEGDGFHAPLHGAVQNISPLAAAMTIAVSITRQPSRVDAAVLAERHRLMHPLGRHTPTTLHGLRRGAHHPVLLAARLSTLAPHMSQADQLTFAITATLPHP